MSDRSRNVSPPAEKGFGERSVSLGVLRTVINARIDETLELVRTRLDHADLLPRFGAGVVLTGGGSHLNGIGVLAEKVFGVPVSIGNPAGISGVAVPTEEPEYAAAIGLVRYGFRFSDRESGFSLGRWLRGFLGARGGG
jgi:cell division protein FtsA